MTVVGNEVSTYIDVTSRPAPGTKPFFDAERKRWKEEVPELDAVRRLRRLTREWGPWGQQAHVEQIHAAIRRAILLAESLYPFTSGDAAWGFFKKEVVEAAERLNPEFGRPSDSDRAYAIQRLRHMLEAIEGAASRYREPTFTELGAGAAGAVDLWRRARRGDQDAAQVLGDLLIDKGLTQRQIFEPQWSEAAFLKKRPKRRRR